MSFNTENQRGRFGRRVLALALLATAHVTVGAQTIQSLADAQRAKLQEAKASVGLAPSVIVTTPTKPARHTVYAIYQVGKHYKAEITRSGSLSIVKEGMSVGGQRVKSITDAGLLLTPVKCARDCGAKLLRVGETF